MFTRSIVDQFQARIVAGLVIAAGIAIGSLTFAVSNIQVIA